MEWKDVTNYSQNEKERKPRCFETKIGSYFRVCIVWGHRDVPGEWVMHFYPLLSCKELQLNKYEDLEAAKEKAISIVKKILQDGIAGIDKKQCQH